MDLTSRIGIAVSGCKNGYAVLAVENMDTGSPLLKQGLRDQRNFMRVTEPGHDFFTMSFTSEAVVLSACRSSVDAVGSSGGYIAVSIFVPVYMQAKGASTLLHSMLEAYWTEYMHPMFGSPLRDKFESAFKLREMLAAASASFPMRELRYRAFPSESQKPPLVCEYTDPAEVDAVMANPFHRQYAQGAEVIFVPRGFMNAELVNHNLDPVEYVTPQRSAPLTAVGRLTLPSGAPFSLTDYTVNGMPYPSPADVSLDSLSRISYNLVLPGGEKKHFEGTLQEALQRRVISAKGDDYQVAPPLFTVRLAVKGVSPSMRLGLGNGRRDPAEGYRTPDGLYEFRIPCSGFPYSLVETKNGKAHRTLARDVVTDRNAGSPAIEVKVTGAAPGLPKEGGRGAVGFKLTKPMLIAIGAVALALVGFLVWLFFLRTPDVPEQGEGESSGQTAPRKTTEDSAKDDKGKDDATAEPEYTYIIVPAETIGEVSKGNKQYDLLLYPVADPAADLEDAGIYYDSALRIEVIRVPKVKGLTFSDDAPWSLNFFQKNGNPISTIELSRTNLPDGGFDDLRNFPKNKHNTYVVVPQQQPLDPAKYKELKAYDPEGRPFKPMKQSQPAQPQPQPATPPAAGNQTAGPSKPVTKNQGKKGNDQGKKGNGKNTGGKNTNPNTSNPPVKKHDNTKL